MVKAIRDYIYLNKPKENKINSKRIYSKRLPIKNPIKERNDKVIVYYKVGKSLEKNQSLSEVASKDESS